MTLFTDNPFEKMMIQKPDYGKGEKSPPELSSPRCAGCPYKRQSPCVGYCTLIICVLCQNSMITALTIQSLSPCRAATL